jgi:hypothetical protein
MKIWLREFIAKVDREDIIKPTIRNESLHEISNDNGARVVNLPHPKILLSKYNVPTSYHLKLYLDIS